jgi:RNA polymerase sigma-70 factor (ECF subfamily)
MPSSSPSIALPGATSTRAAPRPGMLGVVQRRRNPPDRQEQRLARRLRRGDPNVIADLYEEYGSASYGVLLRTLRDRDAADDVQQQVYAEVWRRAAQYDASRAGLLTWILTIARSRAIDHLRRRVPEPVSSDEMLRLTGDGGTPSETELALDRWRAAELLAVLPDHERELLRLRFYEELSQTEIASRLDLPLGTVKARMVRALRKLRAHIDEGEVTS